MGSLRWPFVGAPGRSGWRAPYRVGVELSKDLEGVATYDEIGRELGLTKQNAYTLTMVALGKLAIALLARGEEHF